MTTDKIPDVIYLLLREGEDQSHLWCDHIPNDEMCTEKYLRAEPVEALLKQARDALDAWDEDFAPAPNNYIGLIEVIDKFLEGK